MAHLIYHQKRVANGVQLLKDDDAQALGILIETDQGHKTIYELNGAMLVALWIQIRDHVVNVPTRKQWQGHFPE